MNSSARTSVFLVVACELVLALLLLFSVCQATPATPATPNSPTPVQAGTTSNSDSANRQPRANPWREATNWNPSTLSYLIYVWSAALFVFSYYVYQQDQIHNRVTQTSKTNKNLYMYLGVLSLPYLIGQIFYAFFMTPWFLLSGKVFNFLVTLYFPYRIVFPITDQMIQYGKGMSRSEAKKTLVVLVSIILDIVLVMALIALLILNTSVFRFFITATAGCVLYFVYWRLKDRWNLRWSNIQTKLYLGKQALIYLPIIFALIEIVFVMSFLEALHAYLPIYLFLSQIWIVKTFGTEE